MLLLKIYFVQKYNIRIIAEISSFKYCFSSKSLRMYSVNIHERPFYMYMKGHRMLHIIATLIRGKIELFYGDLKIHL